jgi:DNA-binding transcriptional ArsR family regulator
MEAAALNRLNALIHEKARLGIMSALAARGEALFTELKALLDLTDGNLSVHLRVLEQAGYVGIEKKFAGRKPRTTVRLSKKGRLAFERYVEVLGEIVRRR